MRTSIDIPCLVFTTNWPIIPTTNLARETFLSAKFMFVLPSNPSIHIRTPQPITQRIEHTSGPRQTRPRLQRLLSNPHSHQIYDYENQHTIITAEDENPNSQAAICTCADTSRRDPPREITPMTQFGGQFSHSAKRGMWSGKRAGK